MNPKSSSNHPDAPSSPTAPTAIPQVPEDLKGRVAGIMLSPEMAAAQSAERMMDPCLAEAGIGPATVAELLKAQGEAAANGDLEQVRRTLAAQVATLDRMFHHLFQLAHVAGKQSHHLFERYLRLALKAQAQSAHTSHVLSRLCRETPGETREPAKSATAVESSPSPRPLPASPQRQPADVSAVETRPAANNDDRLRSGGRGTLHRLSAPVGS